MFCVQWRMACTPQARTCAGGYYNVCAKISSVSYTFYAQEQF